MVEETLRVLSDILCSYRKKSDIPVVAITGSTGKTTTKEMVVSMLEQKFCVLKSEENFNDEGGILLTFFKLSSNHQVAVLEIAAKAPGKIKKLAEILLPTVVVITNVGPSHLEFLGSIEGVAAEKATLINFARCVILNADDPLVSKMRRMAKGKVFTFGVKNSADVTAKDIALDEIGRPSFSLSIRDENVRVKLSSLGKHNISNALAAACVGVEFNLNLEQIKAGLESYAHSHWRMECLTVDNILVINDVYNSNPMSLKSSVDFVSGLKQCGRKIAVIGDMHELGVYSAEFHKESGQVIARSTINLIVTVGNLAAKIAEGAIEGGMDRDNVFICKSNAEAIKRLRVILKEGDIILVKGARLMRMEEIINELTDVTQYLQTPITIWDRC